MQEYKASTAGQTHPQTCARRKGSMSRPEKYALHRRTTSNQGNNTAKTAKHVGRKWGGRVEPGRMHAADIQERSAGLLPRHRWCKAGNPQCNRPGSLRWPPGWPLVEQTPGMVENNAPAMHRPAGVHTLSRPLVARRCTACLCACFHARTCWSFSPTQHVRIPDFQTDSCGQLNAREICRRTGFWGEHMTYWMRYGTSSETQLFDCAAHLKPGQYMHAPTNDRWKDDAHMCGRVGADRTKSCALRPFP